MLPSWLNDFGTLVTIITGVPVILGWIISWIISGLGQGIESPPTLRPTQHPRVTLWGSIKTGIFYLVIRPEIPVWDDALKVLLATIILIGDSIFFLWNRNTPIELQIDEPLRKIAFVAIFGLGIIVALLWARLFLKIGYLNRH